MDTSYMYPEVPVCFLYSFNHYSNFSSVLHRRSISTGFAICPQCVFYIHSIITVTFPVSCTEDPYQPALQYAHSYPLQLISELIALSSTKRKCFPLNISLITFPVSCTEDPYQPALQYAHSYPLQLISELIALSSTKRKCFPLNISLIVSPSVSTVCFSSSAISSNSNSTANVVP